jgi:hypothetical protein
MRLRNSGLDVLKSSLTTMRRKLEPLAAMSAARIALEPAGC